MTSRSRAALRRRRRHILGGLIALAVALAVAGAAAFLWFGGRDGELDPASLCPRTGPKGHAVLLVDRTDPFNFTQSQALLQYLGEFGRGKVGEGELLSVFVLGEDFTRDAQPVFQMCNPGRGEGRSLWTANPEQLRRRFEARFLAPMTELAGRLRGGAQAPRSPIMEMLQLVAINGFRAQGVAGPRRLYVVSDMLQNTDGYSQYREEADFQRFRASPLFPKLRAELAGVQVELAYLLTNPPRQTRRHVQFWEDYFRDMGAILVAVRPLEG